MSQDPPPWGITLESPVIRANASKMPRFRLLLPEVLSAGLPGRHLHPPRLSLIPALSRPLLPPFAGSRTPQPQGEVQPREVGPSPRPLQGSAGKIAAGNVEFRNMELLGLSIRIG